MRMTCHYATRADGSIAVYPDMPSKHPDLNPLVLDAGPEAELWLLVAKLASASTADQRAILNASDSPGDHAKLFAALSAFARIGCIELEESFSLDGVQIGHIPPLRKIHLEITHRCNFACSACYLGNHLKRAADTDPSEATTEQWLRVIEDAAALGCQFATLTGGEPFLRADAIELLRCFSRLGILCEINTNASCITPTLAKELGGIALRSVEVSLYGHDEQSARAYTDNAKSFSSTLRGIRALYDANVPFSVKYFATAHNVAGFDDVRTKLSELGVEPRLVGANIHGDIYIGDLRKARSASAGLPRKQAVQRSELPCYPSVNAIAIEPDGQIRACPKLGVHFGNVFQDGLDIIWRASSGLAKFREFWPQFTRSLGYKKGAIREQLCPAADVLSRVGGFEDFRTAWSNFAGQREGE
jgi:MoaA/NifB/PqqE/SkfB family radical SAM enzyme